MLTIDVISKLVSPICKNYEIDRLYLFGSYARGEATDKSDVDFRVDRGILTGFAFGGFYGEIQNTLGIPTDILTTEQLSDKFLSEIKKYEVIIYERK